MLAAVSVYAWTSTRKKGVAPLAFLGFLQNWPARSGVGLTLIKRLLVRWILPCMPGKIQRNGKRLTSL